MSTHRSPASPAAGSTSPSGPFGSPAPEGRSASADAPSSTDASSPALHAKIASAEAGSASPDAGPFAAELTTALAAAEIAAGMIAARAGADEVREKGRADLVTAVDEAVERAVLARIRADFPNDAMVAEESAAGRVESGRRWIVDPIDGTTNFVHGHPFVAVSIAFADADGPAAGVVRAPALGETFHAVRGGGAFVNGRPMRVTEVDRPARSLLATGFPFKAGKGSIDAYFRMLAEILAATQDVRRAGSAALDLAFVAAGRVEGFFETGLAPWDVAAGMLLVTEAGGRVGGWPGDATGPLSTGRVLASNGRIHGWLEEMTAPYAASL
ncbi:MAG TPA: inositol monophosphatase family protein [Longimicrobiaceae bacterium]|jgi:myo-inositol-1(or 4)-monophosphatase|nr:inositol monophosphatase family protein [Longimicrobiaceae bacterium]